MRILGIETSCDETAVAVVEVTRGQFSVLSNVVASQVKIHAKTGGVVPEVAARAHVEKMVPVVEEALKRAHPLLNPPPLRGRKGGGIDAIAVTAGPGLVTSLLVGVEIARTLAWLWKKPVVAVNHLAGHVYANWLNLSELVNKRIGELAKTKRPNSLISNPLIRFPILCLIVSGGHTELVLMRKHLDFEIIGETRDDAAGEAFDKVAKMLGLGYPGGPAISALAEKIQITKSKSQTNSKSQIPKHNYLITQLPNYPIFPRPMIDSPDFDFSFSGLKTAVLYYLKGVRDQVSGVSKSTKSNTYNLTPKTLTQVCYEFQEAVVDVLVAKTVRAAKQYKVKTVLLGGGVAANHRLRQQLYAAIKHHVPYALCSMPSVVYTTDNAAMIAAAGYFMAKAKQFTPWQKLDVDPVRSL